jgi:hypothetical protein
VRDQTHRVIVPVIRHRTLLASRRRP